MAGTPVPGGTAGGQAIACHLRAPEEAIRCAAARALGRIGDAGSAPVLTEALSDPDPDVRTDAMAALERCARPRDAAAIRNSLAGDPVAEVKIAAIRALAGLRDSSSVPLLRRLVRGRCEPDVVWEEPEGSWDDWLDVQVAAIRALGAIGASDAARDLIEAREDEAGQDLDHVVFASLAHMPGRGFAALCGFLRDGNARVRERALAALASVDRKALRPLRDALAGDSHAAIRRIAVDCFAAGDPVLVGLARSDPDPSVRCAAVARAAPVCREVVHAALRDPDETVRAAALEVLASEPAAPPDAELAVNVEAWMQVAGVPLAAVCATVLPVLAGARGVAPLRAAALDDERHPEVRIAAVRSLGTIETTEAVGALRSAVVDRSPQVRVTALGALAACTRSASEETRRPALAVMVDAIRGDLGIPAPDGETRVERPSPGAVRNPAPEADTGDSPYPRSTLQAIGVYGARDVGQRGPVGAGRGQDASLGRERRRRAGRAAAQARDDGPADRILEIRLAALRQAAACEGEEIEGAVADTVAAAVPELRAAALAVIARRAVPLSEALTARSIAALKDREPGVRAAAASSLAHVAQATRHLRPLLDDADAAVRAAAVAVVAAARPHLAFAGFRDPSPLVRRAAVDGTAAGGGREPLKAGLRTLIEKGWSDSLREAYHRYPVVRHLLLDLLGEERALSRQGVLRALEALGQPA